MFSLGSSHTYYLYQEPTDMRKSFDSLSGLVRAQMNTDPFNGSVYVFVNKQRNMIKLLHWEAGGFTLYYKRLEKGQLELPDPTQNKQVQIRWSDLVLIVEGIRLKSVQRDTRFSFKK